MPGSPEPRGRPRLWHKRTWVMRGAVTVASGVSVPPHLGPGLP